MNDKKDNHFNFDLARMAASINSGTISLPRGLSREERRAFIKDALEKVDNAECSKRGCVEIHACIGSPVVWTDEDEARLEDALREVAKKENRASE